MKTPVKALIIAALVLVALPIAAWTGTYFYWHLRIKSAIGEWEETLRNAQPSTTGQPVRPKDLLSPLLEAGCRALPYLAHRIEESSDAEFQEQAVSVFISLLAGPGPYDQATYELMNERGSQWDFMASGLELERKEKLSNLLGWWGRHGSRYHRWWRIWTPWCYQN